MFKPYHSLHFILTTAWDLYFCRLKKQGHSSFGIHWFSSRCCPSGQWHDGRLAKLQECSPFFVIIPQGRVQSDAFSLCWNPSGHTIAKIVWKLKIKNYNNKQKKDIFQINMRYFWKFNNLLNLDDESDAEKLSCQHISQNLNKKSEFLKINSW